MITRLETLRLVRSRRPVLALGTIVFFLSMMLFGFYTYAQTKTGGEVQFRYTFENRSYFNGLTFALYAVYFGSLLVLPVFAATEGGSQLAGDVSEGTVFLLLSRPLSRVRLFFAKVVVVLAFCALLVALLIALSLGFGLAFVGWGDLDLYPGVLQMTARHQHLEQGAALRAFLLSWPAISVALFAPLSLSLLISSHARHPIHAVALALAVYLILYVISQVHFFEALRGWLFTSRMAYWRGLFREEVDVPALVRDALALLGFGFLFLALAFRRFRTREEA